jgi:peptidoglycan/LPS O-acetylase OafA/YrhL
VAPQDERRQPANRGPTLDPHEEAPKSSTGTIAGKPVLPALTGVRIVAALWVVFYHLRPQAHTLFGPLTCVDELMGSGHVGVKLFFVLSGFVISYQYLSIVGLGDRYAYARYLWARLSRIYPLQVFTLLALAAIVLSAKAANVQVEHAGSYSLGGFFLDLTLIRAWVTNAQGWNFPAWSLSAEWFAYVVLFPGLAVPFVRRRLTTKPFVLILMALLAGSIITVSLSVQGNNPSPLFSISTAFPLGWLAFLAFRDSVGRRLPWTLTGCMAAAAMLVACYVPDNIIRNSAMVLLSFTLILALAYSRRGPLVALLSSRLFVYGGKISFALYMTHNITISVLSHLVPVGSYSSGALPERAGIYTCYLLSTVAVAAATYHAVEMPAQRFMRRRGETMRLLNDREQVKYRIG